MEPEGTAFGRLGGGLGLLSLAMLAASVVWVHHWNARTAAIVTVWALATLGALAASWWSLAETTAARSWARLGISLAVVSLGALAVAGIAYAAGASISGACGG